VTLRIPVVISTCGVPKNEFGSRLKNNSLRSEHLIVSGQEVWFETHSKITQCKRLYQDYYLDKKSIYAKIRIRQLNIGVTDISEIW
jgi:hypothetical protein